MWPTDSLSILSSLYRFSTGIDYSFSCSGFATKVHERSSCGGDSGEGGVWLKVWLRGLNVRLAMG